MFAPHWSAFLESNYMDFGTNNNTVFVGGCGPVGCGFNSKLTETTVLVGVNYNSEALARRLTRQLSAIAARAMTS